MSNKFKKWFNETYNKWAHNQPGEEDFLAFCSQLGYPPYQVLSWLHGESTPVDSEVLSIAGLIGIEVYNVLGLKMPEQELLDIFGKFSHLQGEYRSKLALALWNIENELSSTGNSIDSEFGQKIIIQEFQKFGIQ